MRYRSILVLFLVVCFLLVTVVSASAFSLKPQERKGLAIGPRLGAFLPLDDDLRDHLPVLMQTGLDIKAFFWPYIGVNFGLGLIASGASEDEEFTLTSTLDDGTIETETVELNAYYGTIILPMTIGVSWEILPFHVFDPYLGAGGGY